MLVSKLAQPLENVVPTVSPTRIASFPPSLSLGLSFVVSKIRNLHGASLSCIPFLNNLIGIKKKNQLNSSGKKLYCFRKCCFRKCFSFGLQEMGNTQANAKTSQGRLCHRAQVLQENKLTRHWAQRPAWRNSSRSTVERAVVMHSTYPPVCWPQR